MKITKITIILMLIMFGISSLSTAGNQGMKMTMPDGTVIPLDGLNTNEIRQMTELSEKVAKARLDKSMEKASQIATEVIANPEKIDAWRKLVTGTIKDICNDLNVTVNEFIKTPVGMGTAGLIVYNLAGRDILERVFRVMFIVPFWFIVMGILFYLRKKYLSVTTIYHKKNEITQEGSTKSIIEYSGPAIVPSYPWTLDHRQKSEARTTFASILFITGLVTTIVSVIVVLV